MREQRWHEAKKEFAKVIEVGSPLSDHALYQMGLCAEALQETDEEIKAYESLLSSFPTSPLKDSARFNLGKALMVKGEPMKAMLHLEKLSHEASSPSLDRAGLLFAQVEALLQAKKEQRAMRVSRELILLYPSSDAAMKALGLLPPSESPEELLDRAWVYLKHGDYDACLGSLREAQSHLSEKEPLWAKAIFLEGVAQRKKGALKRASDCFEEVVEKAPHSSYGPQAFKELGSLWLYMGKWNKAREAYALMVRFYPSSHWAPEALWLGADLDQRLMDLPSARAQYQDLVNRYPHSSLADNASFRLSLLLFMEGKANEAKDGLRKLLLKPTRRGRTDKIYFWMGKSLLAQGFKEEAQKAFKALKSRNPLSFYSFRANVLLQSHESLENGCSLKDASNFLACDGHPLRGRVSLEPWKDDHLLEVFGHEGEKALFFINFDLEERRWELEKLESLTRTDDARYSLALLYFKAHHYPKAMEVISEIKNPSLWEKRLPLLYPLTHYYEEIQKRAEEEALEPALLLALAREESHFEASARSASGAMGLMQIMPSTGQWLFPQAGLSPFRQQLLYEPSINLKLGSFYLNHLLHKYDHNLLLALASYNAGPGNVKKWMSTYPTDDWDLFIEFIPFKETYDYVKRVMASYAVYHSLYGP